MPTTLDPPHLLEAASALEPERFEQFVNDLLRVRAGRTGKSVGAGETALLARINAGPPAEVWAEYRRLRDLLRQERIAPADHAKLLELTDVIERYQAARAAALGELATVRGQTLTVLMDALGIHGPVAE